jgi:hypothetical protein
MLDTTQSSPPVHRLEKLKANWLKCNVDRVIFSTEGKFDIGIFFRNDHGILVQAHTMYFPFDYSKRVWSLNIETWIADSIVK